MSTPIMNASAWNVFLTVWAAWVAFGLPVKLGPRALAAWRTAGESRAWRTGRVMFYGGILIWSPAALLRKLMGLPISMKPFLAIHFVLMYGGLLLQRMAPRGQLNRGG